MRKDTVTAAILGGSGYTGLELLRLLAGHPHVKVSVVTSRQFKGKPLCEAFPFLRGFYDGMVFIDPGDFRQLEADLVFSALPHGASQEVTPELLKDRKRVIDLSADFRLKDPDVYESWYEGGAHKAKDLLKKAVYGLPEVYRSSIKEARLVANPGCYPTGSILALAPLLSSGLAETGSIIIDSKSGVSGAGRSVSIDTSFAEVSGGFKAYKVGCHRHTPEIEQELSALSGKEVKITFTPHLLPASRGILTTAYAGLRKEITTGELLRIYQGFYGKEPFVRVMAEGSFPNISQVRGSNYCDIGLWVDEKKKRATVISAIDNLVKGASGQAVQNLNIMCGFDETSGLLFPPAAV